MSRILVFGNSHIWPFIGGYGAIQALGETSHELQILDFRGERFQPFVTQGEGRPTFHPLAQQAVHSVVTSHPPDCIVTGALGSDHWRLGMIKDPRPYDFIVPCLPQYGLSPDAELIPYNLVLRRFSEDLDWQFDLIRMARAHCAAPVFHIEAPPPVENNAMMLQGIYAHFKDAMEEFGQPAVSHRYKQWWIWSHTAERLCGDLGLQFIAGPPETRTESGFLQECYFLDGIHGNDRYGTLMAREVLKRFDGSGP